ncbi:MAG TPA: HEAT repeat domain-containing protein [Gemmatimonadaceae bacterium]|nr:HEAT repeat domain-containing protein [Gemmatimonadaceae bacterium]
MSPPSPHSAAGTVAGAPAGAAPDAEPLTEPPFPPALVEELMRNLARAVKTHQLYLPNNPIYQRAIETLRTSFLPVWKETEQLIISITESDFRWEGRAVLHEPNRSDSLPWVFYKDGVRELTIAKGFEESELVGLLDIIQRVRKTAADQDDLLTLLWEQEFGLLRYRFVDIGFDGIAPIEPSPQAEQERTIQIIEDVREAPPEPEPQRRPGIVNMDDLNAALYFLDEHEIDYLRSEIQNEQHSDLPRNVLSLLLDIFEVQEDNTVREELCGIFESMMLYLLSLGQYGAVAFLFREVELVMQKTPQLQPALKLRLMRLPESLSEPGVLSQLLQALDESTNVPPQEELDALFGQLRQGTLGTVLGWLKQAQNPTLRATLERAAGRLASMNTNEMIKLIASEDPLVAQEAMRRAGELKTPAAVAPLARVLQSPNALLRQAATQTLSEIASAGALRLLETALNDSDRDVRVSAVRALGAQGHRAALPKIEGVVKGKAMKGADLTEKVAYFEAYAALAGEKGVATLGQLLNARTVWMRKQHPEIRACSATALGKIGTEPALAALRRAERERNPIVRSAISKALRGVTG